MERVIYHGTDDIYYLPSILSGAESPLTRPDFRITAYGREGGYSYDYSGALWLTFLDEYYHDSLIVRRIWEKIGQYAMDTIALQATDDVLRAYNSSQLDSALKIYALWRYFTGPERGDNYHFQHAAEYPPSYICAVESTYTATITPLYYETPECNGGTNYIECRNGHVKFYTTFYGDTACKWAVYIVGYRQ
jgi:hypothetical protein